jgi:hypothetical protein
MWRSTSPGFPDYIGRWLTVHVSCQRAPAGDRLNGTASWLAGWLAGWLGGWLAGWTSWLVWLDLADWLADVHVFPSRRPVVWGRVSRLRGGGGGGYCLGRR